MRNQCRNCNLSVRDTDCQWTLIARRGRLKQAYLSFVCSRELLLVQKICDTLVDQRQNTIIMAPQVRRVAVIGAGPSGAIATDALVKEQTFDTIRVFDRRAGVGGTW